MPWKYIFVYVFKPMELACLGSYIVFQKLFKAFKYSIKKKVLNVIPNYFKVLNVILKYFKVKVSIFLVKFQSLSFKKKKDWNIYW